MMIKKTTANNNMIVEKLICTSQHDISTEWDHHHCSSSVMKNACRSKYINKNEKREAKIHQKKKEAIVVFIIYY